MTVTVGHFTCKKCDLTFKGEYKPQQRPRKSCPKCHKMCGLTVTKSTKKIRSSQPISPTKVLQQTLESIENPVAYTTAHIFERMIKTGDYRWAQLFVQVLEKTNKLDYETIREQEWLKQANNMSMKDLVEKVAKKESISRSTLRRLDELEDTSQYENL